MPTWIAVVAQFIADIAVDVFELLKLKRPIEKAKARKHKHPRKHIKTCLCETCKKKHGHR